MNIRHRYSVRKRVTAPQTPIDEKLGRRVSKTKQQFKDECDINTIMRKFEKTGVLPPLSRQGMYGDFTTIPDYQTACDMVIAADSQFMKLSSRIRERFQNDPGKFLKFATDPANAEEMVRLGLAVQRPSETNVEEMGGGSEKPSPKKRSAPKAEPTTEVAE